MVSVTSNSFAGLADMLSSRAATVVGVITCYVAMCRGLRYLRRDTEHSQRPYKSREDFQKMTAEDAWQIIKYVQGLEFPWISKKALSFALFKYVTALALYFNTQLTLSTEPMAYQRSLSCSVRRNSLVR